MAQAVTSQDPSDEVVGLVADHGQRNGVGLAPGHELGKPSASSTPSSTASSAAVVAADQGDLAAHALGGGDLAPGPALLQVLPGRVGQAGQDKVGGVDLGDRPVEIAKYPHRTDLAPDAPAPFEPMTPCVFRPLTDFSSVVAKPSELLP